MQSVETERPQLGYSPIVWTCSTEQVICKQRIHELDDVAPRHTWITRTVQCWAHKPVIASHDSTAVCVVRVKHVEGVGCLRWIGFTAANNETRLVMERDIVNSIFLCGLSAHKAKEPRLSTEIALQCQRSSIVNPVTIPFTCVS